MTSSTTVYTSLESAVPEVARGRPFKATIDRRFVANYGVWAYSHGIEPTGSFRTSSLAHDLPDDDWIEKSFMQLVRDEGARITAQGVCPTIPPQTLVLPDHVLSEYLAQCESNLTFGLTMQKLMRDREATAGSKVHQILSDRHLGNPVNKRNVDEREISQALEKCSKKMAPLLFVLLGFPFKEQNELRCCLPADTPDVGEIGLLCRLHATAMAINQIHRFEVHWIIVSDGGPYEDIFGVARGSSSAYVDQLKSIRTYLNLDRSISFVELSSLVNLYEKTVEGRRTITFKSVREHVEQSLERLCTSGGLQSALASLAGGMKWNRGWGQELNITMEELWRILKDDIVRSKKKQVIQEQSIDVALKYAAFNMAMKWTRLIELFFPDAMRATSHPKPGQVGIPRVGSVSPWNGLGVLGRDDHGELVIDTRPLYELDTSNAFLLRRSNGGALAGVARTPI